jgi:hypothetical protein
VISIVSSRSTTHDTRDHDDLFRSAVELLDALGGLPRGDHDRRGSTASLLFEDALCFLHSGFRFGIMHRQCGGVPRDTVIAVVGQNS